MTDRLLDESRASLDKIRDMVRALDYEVSVLIDTVPIASDKSGHLQDAIDHAKQIHFKLADCKGQIGAIAFAMTQYDKKTPE